MCAATRPGSWLLSRILARLDQLVLRLTGNEKSLTTLLTGVPIIQLTTYGAVSGRERVCPLIPLPDGNDLIVFATNFGAQRHPAWYLNLKANPEVLVSLNGTTGDYTARPVEEAARARFWRQAVAIYPGYGSYKTWAAGRKIPIIRLTPQSEESTRR